MRQPNVMNEETILTINDNLQIPLDELQFRFSKSSGPGGQHVNKAETRVTLLFDVASSPSLTDEQKALLLEKLQNRVDKAGILQLHVQTFRSQSRNRDTAVTRLQHLLQKALTPPKKRKRTKPSKAAKEQRLDEKKRRSQIKEERRQEW
jgi:ribosome-associated protein